MPGCAIIAAIPMRPLIELTNISKKFGNQVIVDAATLTVSDEQKTAVIGRNGAGKSTIFRLILGQETLDGGTIKLLPGARIGYLEQHAEFPAHETVIAYLMRVSGKADWACAKLAGQFQLKRDLLTCPASSLSGGYRMRAKLAGMLLQDPNLLLLDEPTNYLDLSTLLLLERFLATYRGSMLVIAHDREFLQRTCTSTLEVERGRLAYCDGDVNTYFAAKHAHAAFVARTNKKVLAQQAHMQEFVDRFRYKASKAKQAQARIKAIAKLTTIATASALKTARITLPHVPKTPDGSAVRCEKLAVGYDTHVVARDIAFDVPRGAHVAIVGNNGQGKTTLLKSLAGALAPLDGRVAWWHRADIGYYAQHVEAALDPSDRVDAYLRRNAPADAKDEDVLRMAGNLLFGRDDLTKTVAMLSGGEKARLCLAGILLHNHNVLLLDEPTNHLDIETSEALATALAAYAGTVLFVSHSRTFTNIVATRMLEARDGTVRAWPHTYEEYVATLEDALDADVRSEDDDTAAVAPDEIARQRRRMELKEKQRETQRLEKTVAELDKKKSALLSYFFDNPTDYAPDKNRELREVTAELAKREDELLRALQTIDTLRN